MGLLVSVAQRKKRRQAERHSGLVRRHVHCWFKSEHKEKHIKIIRFIL